RARFGPTHRRTFRREDSAPHGEDRQAASGRNDAPFCRLRLDEAGASAPYQEAAPDGSNYRTVCGTETATGGGPECRRLPPGGTLRARHDLLALDQRLGLAAQHLADDPVLPTLNHVRASRCRRLPVEEAGGLGEGRPGFVLLAQPMLAHGQDQV